MPKDSLVNTKVILVKDGYDGHIQTMDGPVSWFVSICSSFSSLVVVGLAYSYGIIFPNILEEFQEPKSTTAFVGSLAISCTGFLGPVSARLIDRFGCRVMMICGGLTCAVGLLSSSFSPNIYVLFLTYGICFGFGTSFVYMAAFQLIPLYFERHISFATGLASAGPGIGLLLMSPVVQSLLNYFHWRKCFMILAAVSLVPVVLGCSIKRKKKHYEVKTEVTEKENQPSGRCWTTPDVSVLKDSMFMILCATMVIACLGLAIPIVHLAKYAEDLGLPSHLLFWLYFTQGITNSVSRVSIGKLCDSGRILPVHIFQAGILLFGINDLLLPLCTSFELLICYCCIYGISEGMFVISMICIVLRLFPGEGFGWYICFVSVSFLIGPVLGGLIADIGGSYHPAFVTVGVLSFISFFLPFLLKCVKTSNRKQVDMSCEKEGDIVVYEKVTVL
ncbi:monocarboxylate transporter 12-like [Actinia tenebrosa]|uniref:Monocarboxylate transporter 12-like n=1 Tax=Actinia tenebrosa TaxID=6105 RepID=A0A6P8IVA7_ACTTE|nr:monocarboxylate transporter 12-like [Actinia tenebrosa]